MTAFLQFSRSKSGKTMKLRLAFGTCERFVRTVLYIFTCQEKVMAWLDEQQLASRQVLYVAFGSEVDSVECSCKQW